MRARHEPLQKRKGIVMGKVLTDRPWMTVIFDKGDVAGECANCQRALWTDLFMLDDAYGVIRGVCPHCEAVNLLDFGNGGIRGYSSNKMNLIFR